MGAPDSALGLRVNCGTQLRREAEEAVIKHCAQALDNVLAVVRSAGGAPESVARLTIYVADKAEYVAAARALGAAWRERMGRHYPAMALLAIHGLVVAEAMVEIEATAVVA